MGDGVDDEGSQCGAPSFTAAKPSIIVTSFRSSAFEIAPNPGPGARAGSNRQNRSTTERVDENDDDRRREEKLGSRSARKLVLRSIQKPPRSIGYTLRQTIHTASTPTCRRNVNKSGANILPVRREATC